MEVVEVPDSKGITNCFDFVAKPKNNSLYKICSKTPQDKQNLMNALKKAKGDLETKKSDKERGRKKKMIDNINSICNLFYYST